MAEAQMTLFPLLTTWKK